MQKGGTQGRTIPCNSGYEWDYITDPLRIRGPQKAGVRKYTKKKYNKRQRAALKAMLRNAN